MAKRWYILRVPSGREDTSRDALLKRVALNNLQDQISQVVVPTERVSEIKARRRRVTQRKIYPGYIMVEIETPIPKEAWFLIKETPGIGEFVGSTKKPSPMANHEVEKLLSESERAQEAEPTVKISFKAGDNVKIVEGPFENFDGIVQEVNAAKGTVNVVVTIFGRATPVELEYWQIESI
ncbi:MAG: transcription termination/antitermination protein NusG [Planctomycetota bacterium]|jgi:transcriptional antiterminator NusG